MTWTRFADMYSGGSAKNDAQLIYIEAHETVACEVFKSLFGSDPNNVTCRCCGPDYSITESVTLEEATEYDRQCKEQSPDEFLSRPDVAVIRASRVNQIEEGKRIAALQLPKGSQ